MADQVNDQASAAAPEPAPAEVSTPAPSTSSPVEKSKSSNSMMYVVAFLLTVLIAGGAALFFLMGNDDEDSKKDDDTEESSDSDEEENADEEEEENTDEEEEENTDDEEESDVSEGFESYSNSDFSFEYPEDWTLDSTSYITTAGVAVYRINPDDVVAGDFNDNASAKAIGEFGSDSMTESECEDFGNSVVGELKNTPSYNYDDVELTDFSYEKVNGLNTCIIRFEGVYSGVDIVQEQYLYLNKDESADSYLVTLTTYPDSDFYDSLKSIAESFDIE